MNGRNFWRTNSDNTSASTMRLRGLIQRPPSPLLGMRVRLGVSACPGAITCGRRPTDPYSETLDMRW